MGGFVKDFKSKYAIRKQVSDNMGIQANDCNVCACNATAIDIYNANLKEACDYIAVKRYVIYASNYFVRVAKKIKRKIAMFLFGNYVDCMATYEGKVINVLSVNRDLIIQQQNRIDELEKNYCELSERYDCLAERLDLITNDCEDKK